VRVTVTGASGLIGSALVATLTARGDEVTVLSREPQRALAALQHSRAGGGAGIASAVATLGTMSSYARAAGSVHAREWDPIRTAAPADALAGRDAVVHLAGENTAQRWRKSTREKIRDSRVLGTRHLVAGLRAVSEENSRTRPPVLVSASAIGYYGARREEPLDEDTPPGRGFLAEVCAAWEAEAASASELGLRVLRLRIGVVLDPRGGALARMLPPFRLGLGGAVAGGRQYISWIHREDLVELMLTAIDDQRWSGPLNATAPQPVRNADFSRALGRALRRPALLPVPGPALRLIYGEMASLVTSGARVLPAKALVLGYQFRHPSLDEALRSLLA
jgi:uncharacterized protein (TIGR01777 family)